MPRQDGGSLALWLYGQLPIALAVAAAGAGMVSLIEHAADARTPEPSSCLLAGSVSALLMALVATIVALDADRPRTRLEHRYRVSLAPGLSTPLRAGPASNAREQDLPDWRVRARMAAYGDRRTGKRGERRHWGG
jgi:hypothetical protein